MKPFVDRPILVSGILATLLAATFPFWKPDPHIAGAEQTRIQFTRDGKLHDRHPHSASQSDVEIPIAQPVASRKPKTTAKSELPNHEMSSLWHALSDARRAIHVLSESESELPQNQGVHFFAQNPHQQLTIRFLDGSARIASGRDAAWSATLSLAESDSPTPVLIEDKVEYRHANGVTEIYDNSATGLEHAFVIIKPLDENSDHLRLPLSMHGLGIHLGNTDHTEFANFIDPATGSLVLSYGKLQANDAVGRELAARFETSPSGVEIVVKARTADYPISLRAPIAVQRAKLGPEFTGDGQSGDEFGCSVALSGDTALVGACMDDLENAASAGSVYVFTRQGTVWKRQAKLTAQTEDSLFNFGRSLALSGDTALVTADEGGRDRVFVFTRSGINWSQQAILLAGEGTEYDNFGSSLALSGDVALVGADVGETIFPQRAGFVHIFNRKGSTWNQTGMLSSGEAGDAFGYSVALSGNTAVVGAPNSAGAERRFAGCAHVFVHDGSEWTEQAKLTTTETFHNYRLGSSVAISGDTLLAGAPGSNEVYAFTRSDDTWHLQTRLAATGPQQTFSFGSSVAICGNRAIATAGYNKWGTSEGGYAFIFQREGETWNQQARVDADGTNSWRNQFVAITESTALVGGRHQTSFDSHVFVYSATGPEWLLQGDLSAGESASNDEFGTSVSIFDDTLLIGAAQDDTATGIDAGCAYVFVRSGKDWIQQARLTAGDEAARFDSFGASVALSENTLIVGVPYADLSGVPYEWTDSGSAHVFVRIGSTWVRQTILIADDAYDYREFGRAVSISGNTTLIGSPNRYTGGEGSAYIFRRHGTKWTQESLLKAGNLSNSDDRFGESVAIYGDTALVGAPGTHSLENSRSGSAHVFCRDGRSWPRQAKLTANDAETWSDFGSAVALTENTALIGAPCSDQGNGSAYIFNRHDASWIQHAKLQTKTANAPDRFGYSVALSNDTAVIGAPYGPGPGTPPERVYVFGRSGSDWFKRVGFKPDDYDFDEGFGYSVSISGNTLAVGAPRDDTRYEDSSDIRTDHGSAFVYRIKPQLPANLSVIGYSSKPLEDGISEFSLGSLPINSAPPMYAITLRNIGESPLDLFDIRVKDCKGGDFTLTKPRRWSLAPKKHTVIWLSCTPTSRGRITGTLMIVSSEVGKKRVFTIKLRAN